MITPRGDFTGALKIWMNGQVLFDQSQVKTMYPDVGQTGVIMWLEQTGYGSGLTPTRISLSGDAFSAQLLTYNGRGFRITI